MYGAEAVGSYFFILFYIRIAVPIFGDKSRLVDEDQAFPCVESGISHLNPKITDQDL